MEWWQMYFKIQNHLVLSSTLLQLLTWTHVSRVQAGGRGARQEGPDLRRRSHRAGQPADSPRHGGQGRGHHRHQRRQAGGGQEHGGHTYLQGNQARGSRKRVSEAVTKQPSTKKASPVSGVQVGGGKSAEEMAAEVSTLLGGDMPDVTIECSGAEPSIRWPVTPASCLVSKHDPRWLANTVHWAQLINTKYIRRINIINDPCESEQILPPQLGFCWDDVGLVFDTIHWCIELFWGSTD